MTIEETVREGTGYRRKLSEQEKLAVVGRWAIPQENSKKLQTYNRCRYTRFPPKSVVGDLRRHLLEGSVLLLRISREKAFENVQLLTA